MFIRRVKYLRTNGKTYSEINDLLKTKISKGTLSSWCKNIKLLPKHNKRIAALSSKNLTKARLISSQIRKNRMTELTKRLNRENLPIATSIGSKKIAKVALAMLCLGEASKYGTSSPFYLGSSNPKIILIFLALLEQCFDFDIKKIRCTVQCRADQNIKELEQYWQNKTGVSKKYFYKSRIDTRTIGKPTKKTGYMGVLKIDYLDKKIQLELESLSDLIYNIILDRAVSSPGRAQLWHS